MFHFFTFIVRRVHLGKTGANRQGLQITYSFSDVIGNRNTIFKVMRFTDAESKGSKGAKDNPSN